VEENKETMEPVAPAEPVVESAPVEPVVEQPTETPVESVSEPTVEQPTDTPVVETIMPTPGEAVAQAPVVQEKKKGNKGLIIILIVLLLAIVAGLACMFLLNGKGEKKEKDEEKVVTENQEKKSPYRLSGNGLENFDLYFLQLNNKNTNTVYSPLSIKYALAMLNEGTDGETKKQITALIGDYKPKTYTESKNMAFGNAFFVRDTFKDNIVPGTVDILKNKYNAEIKVDPFTNPDTVNNWIKKKTLNLIDKLVNKDDLDSVDFMIINALGIDMQWTRSFLPYARSNEFSNEYNIATEYSSMDYGWFGAEKVEPGTFKDINDKVAVMDVFASYDNYDPVKAHGGEENYIKEIKNFLITSCKMSEKEATTISKDTYDGIVSNYHKLDKSTEFLFYVDDDVKVFAKDLKEYNGTQLQYVGFMPKKVDLNTFVKDVNATKLNDYISKLKELKPESFEEGYITEVSGTIPKFSYKYDLDLMENLKTLGVVDVFDSGKANLSKLVKGSAFISSAKHAANIEFTQDGIKASAATELGGLGNLASCSYVEKNLPIKKIDITFDNPYMYLVRDKKTGEVWFAGSVYEPLLYKNDPDSKVNY